MFSPEEFSSNFFIQVLFVQMLPRRIVDDYTWEFVKYSWGQAVLLNLNYCTIHWVDSILKKVFSLSGLDVRRLFPFVEITLWNHFSVAQLLNILETSTSQSRLCIKTKHVLYTYDKRQYSLVKERKEVSHDDNDRPGVGRHNSLELSCSFCFIHYFWGKVVKKDELH